LPTVALIVESSATVNEAAGLPAKVTEVAAPVKWVPLTVTACRQRVAYARRSFVARSISASSSPGVARM
jgi:hypothetical protein